MGAPAEGYPGPGVPGQLVGMRRVNRGLPSQHRDSITCLTETRVLCQLEEVSPPAIETLRMVRNPMELDKSDSFHAYRKGERPQEGDKEVSEVEDSLQKNFRETIRKTSICK